MVAPPLRGEPVRSGIVGLLAASLDHLVADRASRSLIQSGVSPGRPAGADPAGYGWGCCRIVVWLSVLPTANSGPPARPDRLPPLQMKPPAVLKSAGSALAGGTAVHWVPFHCSVTAPF